MLYLYSNEHSNQESRRTKSIKNNYHGVGVERKIKYSFWVRAIFTIGLLVLVYSKIDFLGLIDRLAMIGGLEIVLCCTIYFLGQILSAYKWKQLLNEVGLAPTFMEIIRPYFLGMFINSFGLGTVGGDVARVFSFKCQTGKRTSVFASVVADRIHGLIVLSLIGLIALIIYRPAYSNTSLIYAAFGLIFAFILGWFIGPLAVTKLLPEWMPKKDKIVESMLVFPRNKTILFKITLISMLFHFVQIYLAYLLFKMMAQDLSFSTILTSIPFVNVASALPLSINGIGVREGVSMYLLAPAGITSEVSVAFAALWVLIVTIVSGVGGLMVIPGMGEGVGTFLERIRGKD